MKSSVELVYAAMTRIMMNLLGAAVPKAIFCEIKTNVFLERSN